jgi:hypothetical protein
MVNKDTQSQEAADDAAAKLKRTVELFVAGAGLYTSFLTWGLMQEKITGTPYLNSSGSSARWQFSYVLNTSMSCCAYLIASLAFAVELRTSPGAREASKFLPG